MDVLDPLLDPWRIGHRSPGDRRGDPARGVLRGTVVWIASYRLSYPRSRWPTACCPDSFVAALAGVPLLVGAGAGVALAASLVALAGRDERVGADTATAVVVSGMFGLGGLLALSPDAPARLEELLFGDPLGVSDGDLAASAVLAVLGGAALFGLHRPLTAVAFDAAGAAAAGVAPARVRLALLLLLAAALAVAVQGLGSLLVLAVLGGARGGGPAPRAQSTGGHAGRERWWPRAPAWPGIYASHHLGTATGASVALALCAAAALGSLRPPWARRRHATV